MMRMRSRVLAAALSASFAIASCGGAPTQSTYVGVKLQWPESVVKYGFAPFQGSNPALDEAAACETPLSVEIELQNRDTGNIYTREATLDEASVEFTEMPSATEKGYSAEVVVLNEHGNKLYTGATTKEVPANATVTLQVALTKDATLCPRPEPDPPTVEPVPDETSCTTLTGSRKFYVKGTKPKGSIVISEPGDVKFADEDVASDEVWSFGVDFAKFLDRSDPQSTVPFKLRSAWVDDKNNRSKTTADVPVVRNKTALCFNPHNPEALHVATKSGGSVELSWALPSEPSDYDGVVITAFPEPRPFGLFPVTSTTEPGFVLNSNAIADAVVLKAVTEATEDPAIAGGPDNVSITVPDPSKQWDIHLFTISKDTKTASTRSHGVVRWEP